MRVFGCQLFAAVYCGILTAVINKYNFVVVRQSLGDCGNRFVKGARRIFLIVEGRND